MDERMSITTMNSKFAKSIHEDDLGQLNNVLHDLCASKAIHSFGVYKKRDDAEKLQEITIILRRKAQGKIIVCVYQRQLKKVNSIALLKQIVKRRG